MGVEVYGGLVVAGFRDCGDWGFFVMMVGSLAVVVV